MELVTFQEQEQSRPITTASTVVTAKKPRKPGGGRKQIYTSKCVPYNTSIPSEALEELNIFIKALKAKYKK